MKQYTLPNPIPVHLESLELSELVWVDPDLTCVVVNEAAPPEVQVAIAMTVQAFSKALTGKQITEATA